MEKFIMVLIAVVIGFTTIFLFIAGTVIYHLVNQLS